MDDYRYVDFFHASNSGHYKLMYIELGCAFDSDDRAASVRKLKEHLKDDGRTDLVDRIEQRLAPFDTLVRKVLIIRARLIAHKELDVDSRKLYKRLKIVPDDIGKLIATLSSLVNELYEECLTRTTSSPVRRTGLRRLLSQC